MTWNLHAQVIHSLGEKKKKIYCCRNLALQPRKCQACAFFWPRYLLLRCLPHPHDQMGAAHVLSRLKQMKSESVEVVGEVRRNRVKATKNKHNMVLVKFL